MLKLLAFLTIGFTVQVFAGLHCHTHMDCLTCCQNHSLFDAQCDWCPLDRSCHAYASLVNPCLKQQNAKVPTMCKDKKKYWKYDPRDAYFYTLLSAAAYSKDPQTCLNGIPLSSKLDVYHTITENCKYLRWFKYEECFAYTAVSHHRKLILLSYRGTESRYYEQLYDELTATATIPKEPFPSGGNIQTYFATAHKKLYSRVNASIDYLVRKYPKYTVVITGHSLGAALASLSAVLLVYQNVVPANRMSLYTFGMPRVGDKEYAFNHDRLVANSWRVVHRRDIVSHIPTCNLITGCSITTNGPYHHRNEIFYPNDIMKTDSEFIICKGDEDYKCSDGLITREPCIDMQRCICYHEKYFGINVGDYCNDRAMNHTQSVT